MKEQILANSSSPETLEQLYRNNKQEFTRAMAEIPDDASSGLIRFWKVRLVPESPAGSRGTVGTNLAVMIGLALITGLLTRLPLLFKGIPLEFFYLRDLAIVLFNGLILYTFWQNKLFTTRRILIYSGVIALLLLFVNLLPDNQSDSLTLSMVHVPLLLWSLFGLAFVSFDYKTLSKRIEFIRFNGELLVMTGLLLIAAAVITGLTVGLFSVIKLEIYRFAYEYIGFFCGAASPIVAYFLIRKFPGITSKITPVLARVFTPVVLLTLTLYLVVLLATGSSMLQDRELLIVFNVMLLGVTAIIVFSISALDKTRSRNSNVLILFLLALMTLVINSIALIAIISRISQGITPNRLVVLITNLLIFINLILISIDLYRSWFKRKNPEAVEITVARYLTVYALWTVIAIFILPFLFHGTSKVGKHDFSSVSRVESGKPVSVMLTTYSTTLLANGKDQTLLRIAVTDSLSREITPANDSIRVYLTGDGKVTNADGKELVIRKDTAGIPYAECQLLKGTCQLLFIAGTQPGKVKIEARAGHLWPGGHEIHTIPSDAVMLKPTPDQLPATTKPIDRMIGADISFLPSLEDRGMKFFDSGKEIDAITLLKNHGFTYIRLRIFVNPENPKGYSPDKGYCGLSQTLAMAHRIQDAGMKLLLDFHYSDYWADPQQQNKPLAWAGLDFETLKDSVKGYTTRVLQALKNQGTPAAMVQIGNEVNHGLLWPDGHIGNLDGLAGLLKAGVEGTEAADPALPVMMHIALGGQNDEARCWLDNMIARGVRFDIIGLSYYPRWHGTLEDLANNMNDLKIRYNKPMNVVEYSDFKKEVHDIVFSLPDGFGKGACIWEPLNWGSGLFDRNGSATPLFSVYDNLKFHE